MSEGIEKARELNDKLKEDIKNEKPAPVELPAVKVEHHNEVAVKRQGSGIVGLEDVPTDIIPLPFYKLVGPNSKKVNRASDGKRATPGSYFTDLNEEVATVRSAIIRAKRTTREMKNNETGQVESKPVINILAVDTSNMSPFLISVSKGSFSNFGRMMNWFVKAQVKHVFDYPVILGSQFVETGEFPYWAMTFTPEKDAFSKDDLETMAMVYNQYASVLDRGIEEEDLTDSAGRVIEDIPFPDEVR